MLEQRLLMRESVLGFPSVTKIATKLKELKEKQDQTSSDAFVRELHLYRLETNKTSKILAACDAEAVEYNNLESTLLKQIEGTEESIQQLVIELEQEKQLRKHREECDLLSRDVTKFASRSVLEKETKNIDEAIRSADQSITDMNDRIQQRISQFKALLQAIADLKGSLREEEEQLKQALLLQQQQQLLLGGADDEGIDEIAEDGDREDSRADGRDGKENEKEHDKSSVVDEGDEGCGEGVTEEQMEVESVQIHDANC